MQQESDEEVHRSKVQGYYDYTRRFYRVFWHGKTNALHYGFHDESTKDHESALVRAIEKTAMAGSITKADVVADLGCGIGGSAFWIAKYIGAKVEGITLSKEQFRKAIKLSKKFLLETKTKFKIGDFFHTEYRDSNFDVVIGIESLCHGQYKVSELAQELYRITKTGGRLVVTDGFLSEQEADERTKEKIKLFENGFVIEKLVTVDAFKEALLQAGFRDISFTDWTENIMPSAEKMYRITKRWHGFIVLATRLKMIPDIILKNNITGQVQLELFSKRMLVYGCIVAKK